MQISNNLSGVFSRKSRTKTIRPSVAANRQKFLDWLQSTNPTAYTAIMRKAGLQVMGADTNPVTNPTMWESIVAGAKEIIPTLVQAKAQQQIFKAQMQRATQGLPPLQPAEYAPTVRVQAGISPGITDTLKKMALPLGIGAAALLFFVMKKKGR